MREITVRAYSQDKWFYFTIGQVWSGLTTHIYNDLIIEGVTFYQNTGLKDKNGKDIYEGDVLQPDWNRITGIVVYDSTGAYFKFENDMNEYDFTEANSTEYEVIGNIHQNADLL